MALIPHDAVPNPDTEMRIGVTRGCNHLVDVCQMLQCGNHPLKLWITLWVSCRDAAAMPINT